jgi:carbon monoxide dehydrogenase subunit G
MNGGNLHKPGIQMLNISANAVEINANQVEVFNFLSDFNNFNKLLPQDRVEDFESTTDTCSFSIKGLATIGMKIDEKVGNDELKISSHGKNPFPFTIQIKMEPLENGCKAQLFFQGDMNAFLKMMAEKPLANFFNMLSENLKAIYA